MIYNNNNSNILFNLQVVKSSIRLRFKVNLYRERSQLYKCCVQNIFKVVEEYHLQIDKNFDLNKCLSILRRMVNIGHIVCIGCIPNRDR